MTGQEQVTALSLFISIIGLLCVYRLFRSAQLDRFREEVFSLREDIFLYAFDQNLLDNPAHREFRALLNGTLRFAHKATFEHMICLRLTKRIFKASAQKEENPMKAWALAVHALSPEQMETFHRYNRQFVGLLVKRIAFSSLLFWPYALWLGVRIVATKPITLSRQPKSAFKKLEKAVQKHLPLNLLEAEALREISSFSGGIRLT